MEKTRELWEEVERVKEQINHLRYLGQDPPVEIGPEDSALTVAAKVIAAERLGARLTYDSTSVNPLEDLASEALHKAMTSLQFWNFYATRLYLDEAARSTREPTTYQRIALLRLLAEYLASIVRTHPGSEVRSMVSQAHKLQRALSSLDSLPQPERQHYIGEIERILSYWRQAARDPYLCAIWCLVRARRSMDAEEPLLGLVWIIKAYGLLTKGDKPLLKASPYLGDLIEKARTHLFETIGENTPGERQTEGVRAEELFSTMVALIAQQLDRNPMRDMALFGITSYQPGTEG